MREDAPSTATLPTPVLPPPPPPLHLLMHTLTAPRFIRWTVHRRCLLLSVDASRQYVRCPCPCSVLLYLFIYLYLYLAVEDALSLCSVSVSYHVTSDVACSRFPRQRIATDLDFYLVLCERSVMELRPACMTLDDIAALGFSSPLLNCLKGHVQNLCSIA